MTEEPRPPAPGDEPGPVEPPPAPGRGRRLLRGAWRGLRLLLMTLVIALAVILVTTFTVDLGPSLRELAERGASGYLKREVTIGRLSVRLLTGAYVVEDLVIGGLEPSHRPFFTAKSIEVRLPLQALAHREVLLESIVMSDWDMLVETWPDGRHNFPKIAPDRPREPGPRRFVTTLKWVHARNGRFTYEDHGLPWGVVARNLDVTVTKAAGYGGEVRSSGGTVTIQDYVPMATDLEGVFTLEGPLVKFSRLDLTTDGSSNAVTGEVDLSQWPEQTWQVRSTVDFPRMKELFFTREPWRVAGTGSFDGVFHLFKGGRELKGRFASGEARVNDMPFRDLEGSLLWIPGLFEVKPAAARWFGGRADFTYAIRSRQPGQPSLAEFDTTFRGVDLAALTEHLRLEGGLRLAGRLGGGAGLEWDLGRLAATRKGRVNLALSAPPETPVLGPVVPQSLAAALDAEPRSWGPFNPDPALLGSLPVGGTLDVTFGPARVDVGPSALATPRTFVEFEGRTDWGEDSEIPFHVTSADWQESDRVLAAILTAFGARTGAVPVGGRGTFDGVMRQSFRRPLIEGRFEGDALRAWDVVWGRATGDLVIEDGYVTLTGARVTDGASAIETEGRYALGYPRRDGGEEINARVRVMARPMADLRHAFELDDWPVDGRLSGEFHLYGKYQTPFGFGKLEVTGVEAWGEPVDRVSASLRFEGNGVRLDGLEGRKAEGTLTGAAFVGWNGTYSFNVSGRRLPVEQVLTLQWPQAPLSGLLEFTAAGSGQFEAPRYDVRLGVSDLFVKDEGIGEVTARLAVRNQTLSGEIEAASPRLAVSGTGRIALTPEADAEISLRITDTSLDPYVRAFEPGLSPFTTAIASGTVRAVGELRNPEHLLVDVRADKLDLRLFDYALQNDGPIQVVYDQQILRADALRLVGDGTRLEVRGQVDSGEDAVALRATGEANLGILQGFFRDIRSAGQADLQAEIAGTMARPVFSGEATIAGGRLRHFGLPHALEAVNGRLTFDARGVAVDGLTARLGGGLVRFGGRVGLNGYRPDDLSLTAVGEEMRLRYPEGFRSVVDADLALRGAFEAPVLTGTVTVRSSVWTRRFEASGNFLEFAGRAAPLPSSPAAAASLPLRFDVRIVAPSSLRIENNLARIVSSADLLLRGTYDRPLLFGRADIDRGEVTFEGKRYVVTRGTIDFSNPNRIEPFFDVEAETRVRVPGQTYRVTLNAVGTLDRIQGGVNSDPPLSPVDILSLLLSDAAPQDPELRALRTPEAAAQQLLQARAAQLLVSPISSGVGGFVEQQFGVDTFQITPSLGDPYQQSSRLNPGARLTIGKRISDRVYLTFSQSLSATATSRDQIILLEYDQSDRLSWILSQNEDRTYALDVRVRYTF